MQRGILERTDIKGVLAASVNVRGLYTPQQR
jgi:hypothetical protein